MSKGLEALERLYKESNRAFGWEREEQHKKDKVAIEKELKRLEIIREKKVNMSLLFNTKSHWDYNDHVTRAQIYLQSNSICLTQEEYNFLKEVLK